MPKKRNFLGGMQNYNAKTGEYEPDLKGPNGEAPSNFKSFKKGESQHDKINDKRMGKGLGYDPRNREESTKEHNRRIEEINDKYGRNKMSKEEYWDAIDLEVDRWNNEQQYWYEHEETPYDKEIAKKQAERHKHGGIAGELEGLGFSMDTVDEENQILEFEGQRGNYKIVQSKDNPANYETYLNDELVMRGQGGVFIAKNIKRYDTEDDFVEKVKAKNEELSKNEDKSFENTNAKRMGKNALGYGEKEINQLKEDALKFLKGSLTEEEYNAIKDDEKLLNDYSSGKYSVGDVKRVAKIKLG